MKKRLFVLAVAAMMSCLANAQAARIFTQTGKVVRNSGGKVAGRVAGAAVISGSIGSQSNRISTGGIKPMPKPQPVPHVKPLPKLEPVKPLPKLEPAKPLPKKVVEHPHPTVEHHVGLPTDTAVVAP